MQPTLFDNPTATSQAESLQQSRRAKRDAYESVASATSKQREEVLLFIRECGIAGCTRYEIADSIQIPVSSVCGRVNELLNEDTPRIFVKGRRDNRSVLFAKGYC